MALTDLEEDEEILTIHRSEFLNTENSDLKRIAPDLFTIDIADPWLELILVMIYEYMKGSDSHWKPYFDILPTTFNTLMFWTDKEVQQLQKCAVRDKIGINPSNFAFTWKVIPIIRASPNIFPMNFPDEDLLALCHRMGSTVMAYAFDVESIPGQKEVDEEGYVSEDDEYDLPKAMIPFADMLNADAELNNARLFYDVDTVSMRTIKPVKAGDELYNDYGPLPRADLLRRYGYMSDRYTKYDVAEMSWTFVIEATHYFFPAWKVLQNDELGEALEDAELYQDDYVISNDNEEEEEPMFPFALQILLANIVRLKNGQIVKLIRKVTPEMRQEISKLYITLLEARYSQFDTSIAQDRQLLLNNPDKTSRLNMAIRLRLAEKIILQTGIEREKQKGLASNMEEQQHKRQRTS